jgi:hypothetical protein
MGFTCDGTKSSNSHIDKVNLFLPLILALANYKLGITENHMWPSKSGSDLPGRGVWPDVNDVGAQLGHGRRHALIPSRFLRLLRGIGLLDTCHLGALDNDRGVEDGMQEVRDGGRHHGLRCIRHPTTSPEETGMASAKVIGGTTTTSSSLVPCQSAHQGKPGCLDASLDGLLAASCHTCK